MPINGYILINSKKCLVTMEERTTRRVLRQRSKGEDGVHLEEVQALLQQPGQRPLVDQLRHGMTIYLPKGTLQ